MDFQYHHIRYLGFFFYYQPFYSTSNIELAVLLLLVRYPVTLRVIVFSPLALACPIFHGVTIGRYLDGKVVHSIDRSLEKSNNSIIDHLVLFYRTIFGARMHGIKHHSRVDIGFCHLKKDTLNKRF